uniref:Branchpoint-bridging protein n=1 Tax=Arion vulgaris TaxID=1028688 RepID=A0A0B7A886_9EUPU
MKTWLILCVCCLIVFVFFQTRSPSPEPIYNNEGKRMNTREYRTRKKLEEDRHKLIQEAIKLNTDFKPPSDYKPPIIRVNDKVMIPQEEHPDINFVGLLIGPRGNTLKTLEKDTGAKIIIRGKGSVKDGKIGRKDGQPLPGEDEPLHAYVTANNPENVKKAVEKIKEIIKQGIEVPEGQNDLRRQQLRELALLNGTLRENDGLAKLRQIAECQTIVTNTIMCTVCGGAGHIAQDCKQKRPGDTFRVQQMQNPAERAKMDSEYMSLMAELGEGPPPPPKSEPSNMVPTTYGRTLLSNPPPNPMAMNSPWQMNNRPPFGQMSVPLLNRPPAGMQQGTPQINPLGRLPVPFISSTMQPPPGMQGPPGLMPPIVTSQQQQPPPMMGGMGSLPQMQQQQNPGMLRPWQQQPQVSQPHNLISMSNTMATNSNSLGM